LPLVIIAATSSSLPSKIRSIAKRLVAGTAQKLRLKPGKVSGMTVNSRHAHGQKTCGNLQVRFANQSGQRIDIAAQRRVNGSTRAMTLP
jgi:hypothetical protein